MTNTKHFKLLAKNAFFMLFFINNAYSKTHEIFVSSNIFSPSSLVIEAGDTVLWRNTGGGHNVFANEYFRCAQGCEANGGNGNASSELWISSITFRTLGTRHYICEPHISFGMQGSITVVQPQSVGLHEVIATSENLFTPNEITITRGDVIRFTNGGGVHNIQTDDDSLICSEGCLGDGTNTDNGATGFPWDIYIKFNQIEEIPYFCEQHNNTGVIRVVTDTFFVDGFEANSIN